MAIKVKKPMSGTFVAKKTVEQETEKLGPQLSDIAGSIDSLGVLVTDYEALLKKHEKVLQQIKEAKTKADNKTKEVMAQVTEMYAEKGDDDTGKELGVTYQIDVKKKGSSRKVTDLTKVRKFMKDPTFMKVATVNLKDIDAYLTPDQIEQCVTTDRTDRGITVSKRVDVK